jgi:hypothetical protein
MLALGKRAANLTLDGGLIGRRKLSQSVATCLFRCEDRGTFDDRGAKLLVVCRKADHYNSTSVGPRPAREAAPASRRCCAAAMVPADRSCP